MNDYNTTQRRAWLRYMQSSIDYRSKPIINPVTEFLGALAIFALPFLLLFIGAMLGL